MAEELSVHEEEPVATSSRSTSPLPSAAVVVVEKMAAPFLFDEVNLLDVNLSQAYLNDESVAALLERDKRLPIAEVHNNEANEEMFPRYSNVLRLNFAHNEILRFPERVCDMKNLIELDLSNNHLTSISERIGELTHLRIFSARNNSLDDLPKSSRTLRDLRTLNISGNVFKHVPAAVFEMRALVELQLGANSIETLPAQIGALTNLEILYLGGNRLSEVPATLGRLTRLTSLVLADNHIETLPPTFAELQALQSLTLHHNQLRALPTGIARLPNLQHLSLRNNPLVTSFVEAVRLAPPTLKELAARVLKVRASPATEALYASILPHDLRAYLASANHCVNPRCRGVYFESCAELVKFVDFCGKYRVPLMQYLCSPHCTQTEPTCAYSDSSDHDDMLNDQQAYHRRFFVVGTSQESSSSRDARMKKILLG